MAATIPGVEIADDADTLGIGRPDCEGRSLDAVDGTQVRAEAFERPEV